MSRAPLSADEALAGAAAELEATASRWERMADEEDDGSAAGRDLAKSFRARAETYRDAAAEVRRCPRFAPPSFAPSPSPTAS